MKCMNHSKVAAKGMCTVCGNSFCSDCLLQVKRKNICIDCAGDKLSKGTPKSSTFTPVVAQQQQQQQQEPSVIGKTVPSKPLSLASTIKWAIAVVMWVFALSGLVGGHVLGGLIFLVLGVYWTPPVSSWVQIEVKKKWDFDMPRWARIIASIFLFFVAIMAF